MAYTDYNFYKNTYLSQNIPETDFPRFAERASEKIDRMTFFRLNSGLPSDSKAAEMVKKAVCAVAEILCGIEQYSNTVWEAAGYEKDNATGKLVGKIVTGKSAGNESVSYSAASHTDLKGTLVGAVLNDKRAQERLIYDTAAEYISGVCTDDGIPLLFAGVLM